MVSAIYLIVLTDPAQVLHYRSIYAGGIAMSPAHAAGQFGAPIGGIGSGGVFIAPGIFVPIQGSNLPAFYSEMTGVMGAPNCSGPHGESYPDSPFYWLGFFVCQGTPVNFATPTLMLSPPGPGEVRFMEGFELPRHGSDSSSGYRFSRDASRTPDGMGYAYRSNNNDYLLHATGLTGPWPKDRSSAERFYLRLRTLPTGDDMIWQAYGHAEGGGPTLHVDVTPGGVLELYNQGNGAAPGTLIAITGVLQLNQWYRIDVQWNYGTNVTTPPAPGGAVIWVNGEPFGIGSGWLGPGLGTPQHQVSGRIGNGLAASHGLECDIDDWINSASFDVRLGTHIALLRATGFGALHNPAWVGDWRQLVALDPETLAAVDTVSTVAAGAELDVVTETLLQPQYGMFAILVSAYVKTGPGLAGALTLTTDTGVIASAAVTFNTGVWTSKLWTVMAGYVRSAAIRLTKDAGINVLRIAGFYMQVAYSGYFGPEDLQSWVTPMAPATEAPLGPWIHNSPYPTAAGALISVPVVAPLSYESGVYTGNDLGQSLLVENPPHWYWVRPLASDAGGVWWWSTLVAAAGRLSSLLFPLRMAAARLFGLSSELLLGGPDAQSNANAVQYQWIAVSDPGHRFMLNGAFAHAATVASATNLLQDPLFTPEGLFVTVESAGSTPTKHYFKGVGHGVTEASLLDTAVASGVVAIGSSPGSLVSQTPLHLVGANALQTAYSAWRRVDEQGQTGWFDLITYTGDGTGNRDLTVNLNPTDCDGNTNGGVSPLFAIVTPHDGLSYFRDPSHLTTHSSRVTGVDSTTAIIGGDINLLRVGTTLNAAGVVYDVFVIGGLAVPGGWSGNPVGPICPVCPGSGPEIPPPGEPPVEPPPPPPREPPPDEPPPAVPTTACVSPIFGVGS
jgi:hypothetical protein